MSNDAKNSRAYRDKKKLVGLCTACGKEKSAAGRVRCPTCLEDARNLSSSYVSRRILADEKAVKR